MQQKSSQLRVAYLGPPASFSHQAALEAFPDATTVTLHPLPSFESIFSAIQHSSLSTSNTESLESDSIYDFALIPVENSINGSVLPILDLLAQCGLDPNSCSYPDVEVVAEHYLEVHHCLLVHPDILKKAAEGEPKLTDDTLLRSLNITTLYTHPQVWGQCTKYLSKYFPPSRTERIDMSSTSAAAVFVAQHSIHPKTPDTSSNDTDVSSPHASAATKQGNIAAISSSLAQAQNKLACLAANIEDEPDQNTTRFLIIRHRSRDQIPLPPSLHLPKPSPGQEIVRKSLITFTLPHRQKGALAEALAVFAAHGFNLTAITTRPSREENWHYVFFVRCEESQSVSSLAAGAVGDERLRAMLKELIRVAERTCLLGTWMDETRFSR